MLAARMFGLGATWTSFHLFYEQAAANMLNIPYQQIMRANSGIRRIERLQRDPGCYKIICIELTGFVCFQ